MKRRLWELLNRLRIKLVERRASARCVNAVSGLCVRLRRDW